MNDLLCVIPLVVDVKVPILQKRNDVTVFKMMTDFETQPILFIPDIHFTTFQRHVSASARHGATVTSPVHFGETCNHVSARKLDLDH